MGSHINIVTNKKAVNSNNNDNNDDLNGSSKAETIPAAINIGNYEPYYHGYAFFLPVAIMNVATNTTKPHKTYMESDREQVSPTSPLKRQVEYHNH